MLFDILINYIYRASVSGRSGVIYVQNSSLYVENLTRRRFCTSIKILVNSICKHADVQSPSIFTKIIPIKPQALVYSVT